MKVQGYIPPKKALKPQDPGEYVFGGAYFFHDLQTTKAEITQTADRKVYEVEKAIEAVKQNLQTSNQKINEIDVKIAEFERTAIQLIKDIRNIPQLQGNPGQDADEEKITQVILDQIPTKEEIVAEVVSMIPKPDTKAITDQIFKAIPEDTSLRANLTTDPLSVIEKIMALPNDKKLKTKHIDGLDQTIASIHSQLGRGYLHGGGDVVTAGTNITITTNAAGKKVISATGGVVPSFADDETPTGLVNSSNVVYTLAHTPSPAASLIFTVNGQILVPGGVDYTLATATVTVVMAPATGAIVRAWYRY